jgi:hypothetical protein
MRRLAFLLLAFALPGALFALPPDPASLLTAEASLTPAAQPGRGTLAVRAKLQAGWHVNSHTPSEEYLIPTTLALAPAAGVKFGEPLYPEGKTEKFSFSESPLSVYAGEF